MKRFTRLSALLAAVISVAFTSGCTLFWLIEGDDTVGNGHVTNEIRAAADTDFDAVVLNGIGEVNIRIAAEHKVVISTDENVQDFITVRIRNGVLYIDKENYRNAWPTKLVINVYMPQIKTARLNGVGGINIIGGSGHALGLYLKGVGDINASGYKAKTAKVDLDGVGDIVVWATEELNGSLSGVGDVYYRGAPEKIDINKTGVGNVKPVAPAVTAVADSRPLSESGFSGLED